MIHLNDATNENERRVLQLMRAMETGDLPATLRAICTEDFCWTNSGLADIQGLAELEAHMAKGGFASQIAVIREMTHFSAELIHMASRGDVVFTERVDHHWSEDGRDLMTPHICGIAELREGRISAFRDFYDVACYEQVPTPVQPGFSLAEFRAAQAAGEA